MQLSFSPSEFVDKSDMIGLFAQEEPQPHQFLALESLKEVPDQLSQDASLIITMESKKYIYERSAFSFIMLLSELGGLFGAISSIPSIFISTLVKNLFVSSLVQRQESDSEGESVDQAVRS